MTDDCVGAGTTPLGKLPPLRPPDHLRASDEEGTRGLDWGGHQRDVS